MAARLRRVNSVNKVGDIDEYERKERLLRPDDPIHAHADSMFSTSSGFNNYRGLFNLCILLLALSNARLFLENIMKYGVLIDPVSQIKSVFQQSPQIPNVTLVFGINIFIFIAFYTECAIAKGWLSESKCWIIHAVNVAAVLILPALIVLVTNPNPAFSAMMLAAYTIVFLKLISYAAVNRWCRDDIPMSRRKRSKSLSTDIRLLTNSVLSSATVTYPDNLTYKDLYYFMFAPTLCYELRFPKSPRIRKRFLVKRIIEVFYKRNSFSNVDAVKFVISTLGVIELIELFKLTRNYDDKAGACKVKLFLLQLMLGLVQQWIIPTIKNSIKPLDEMNVSRVVERLLKLAIPNLFIWLMFFYWFFHSCLNVLAELMRFADREFYRDWWNAEKVSLFWKNWNVPVHRWCNRHLFKPMVKRGYSKSSAAIAVFFLSAFFHEYLVSIPLRMFKIWAFTAMLAQVPLAILVSKYLHGHYGNMAVWLSIIIGQPIAILAYFHDYYVINQSHETLAATNTTHNTWSLFDVFRLQ